MTERWRKRRREREKENLREIMFWSSFLSLFYAGPKPRERRLEIEKEVWEKERFERDEKPRERMREIERKESDRSRERVGSFIHEWTVEITPPWSHLRVRKLILGSKLVMKGGLHLNVEGRLQNLQDSLKNQLLISNKLAFEFWLNWTKYFYFYF